jgi:hypothetical protein
MLAFPGFDHIYELRDPLSKRPLRGDFQWEEDCSALTRGEITPATAIRVSWAMGGRHPVDVIWTTSVLVVVIHSRFLDLFQKNGVTGWRSYRVVVTDRDGKVYTDYDGLTVVGRCDAVDLSRSVVVVSKYPGGWYPHFLGHYFDEKSWDGSDLFMARPDSNGGEAASIFVTERVREIFGNAKINNVRLERLTEKTVSTSVYEIGCSHLLPGDFSKRVTAAYVRADVPRPK